VPWPPRFLFHTGRPSLDFAHTGGEGPFAKFERLHATRDLADWFAASSLHLRVSRVTRDELEAAVALRGVIWRMAVDVVRGEDWKRRDLSALQSVAAGPDLVPVLTADGAGWARGSNATRALSSLARDAIALFGGPLRERIRECRNPRCPLLFVDTSRPGKRVWCLMRRCGNLEKTARYRAGRKARRR